MSDGPFVYEIASMNVAIERAHAGHPKGLYALPVYLVVGEPGSGRSTAIRSMDVGWQGGDGTLHIGAPQQQCTYWMAEQAIFIEPEAGVLGQRRSPGMLEELCAELRRTRPREPIDGILLVINIAEFIDLDERGLDEYANRLRTYMIEVGRALHADVPTYAVLTRYDTLWGFAEVFQWTPDRRREEPWGFTLPFDTDSQSSVPRIKQELEGLNARFEAFCLYKLLSEDPPEQRTRAFQHLAEVRALRERLGQLFGVLAMASSFERAPWFRAAVIGCAVPGTGDRLRAGVTRFLNMGLVQPQMAPAAARPGGLPIFAFMKTVVLPERDLVPLRTRWRDDTFILFGIGIGLLLLLATGITEVILSQL
jgi:type VI secretion system protein ImpL